MTILWPPIAKKDGMPLSLAALLPDRNHNRDVLVSLKALQGKVRENCVAPIFMADPFLNLRVSMNVLSKAGCVHVAALPCVGQYGEAFGASLEALGVGQTREFENMQRFRQSGFHVIPGAASDCPVKTYFEPADTIFVLPKLDDPEGDALSPVLQRRARLVRQLFPDAEVCVIAE